MSSAELLRKHEPVKPFFVAVDSDGCAFDTMNLKHKNYFIPAAIEAFGYEAIAEQFRKQAEEVNLYSTLRGVNRFQALYYTLEFLKRDKIFQAAGIDNPDTSELKAFAFGDRPLANDSLAEFIEERSAHAAEDPLPVLRKALQWSETSNRRIAEGVTGNPPYENVAEALARITKEADTMICSATPGAALRQEWGEAGILAFMDLVAGQEVGSKAAQLEAAAAGKYEPKRVLMIGDAPGDLNAAKQNGFCFFPIIPGGEAESWALLRDGAFSRFIEGSYAGEYESRLIESYKGVLREIET